MRMMRPKSYIPTKYCMPQQQSNLQENVQIKACPRVNNHVIILFPIPAQPKRSDNQSLNAPNSRITKTLERSDISNKRLHFLEQK